MNPNTVPHSVAPLIICARYCLSVERGASVFIKIARNLLFVKRINKTRPCFWQGFLVFCRYHDREEPLEALRRKEARGARGQVQDQARRSLCQPIVHPDDTLIYHRKRDVHGKYRAALQSQG